MNLIASASRGTHCFSRGNKKMEVGDDDIVANANLTKSWLLLHTSMLYIIFDVLFMSVVKWWKRNGFAKAEAQEEKS